MRRLILGESLGLTGAGVAAGLLLGVAIGRVMSSVFGGVAAFDALIFTVVPAALVAAALVGGVAARTPRHPGPPDAGAARRVSAE